MTRSGRGWMLLVLVGLLPGLLVLLGGCGAGAPWPGDTAGLSPRGTPVGTQTPEATPTPSPLPTLTPTPTPLPIERLTGAQQAFAVGDWDTAIGLYRGLLAQPSLSDTLRDEATLGLALTYLADAAYGEAAELLTSFLDGNGGADPAVTAKAHILLGDALRLSDAPLSATQHYSAALTGLPILAPYGYAWQGDAYLAAGVLGAAAEAYTQAIAAADIPGRKVGLMEDLASVYIAQGDPARAVQLYDEILSIAGKPSYRAHILYQAAQALLIAGETDAAYARMADLIATYPEDPRAYDALVLLVDVGYPVDDMLRGMVDLHAGAYGPAVQAFIRVIQNQPEHTGAPHYYMGRAFLAAGSLDLARQAFEDLIETHPQDPLVPDAWMGKAQVLVLEGRIPQALAAMETGLSLYPVQQETPDVAWEVVSALEDRAQLSEAAALLSEIALRFPNDPRAPQARFRAGLDHYRAGEGDEAHRVWQELVRWYPYDPAAQAAWYWLGKGYLATGETLSATHAFSEAVAVDPWAYYGLQAADRLAGREAFRAYPAPSSPCDQAQAQEEAEAWLSTWLATEPDTPLSELPPELADHPRLQRGTLLLRLGHFDEGRTELEQLRLETSDDPLTQYRLALIYRDVGLYRSSILAATTLWRLSPVRQIDALPPFIACLIYPRYYAELIEREARSTHLSPLLVYALLRQESLFEGQAMSFAAAHGLMQVIPSTGAQIAEALGWPPDYETRDLYRPMVSVRFGVWYLAQQRDRFEGSLYAALAAYNGGPGNASRWWEAADGDEDLFVELIDFGETQRYVRLIREHYARYRWLYGAR